MSFKSEAQKLKFMALVKEGKMSQETFDKWMSETPQKQLPKKIGPTSKAVTRRPRKTRSLA